MTAKNQFAVLLGRRISDPAAEDRLDRSVKRYLSKCWNLRAGVPGAINDPCSPRTASTPPLGREHGGCGTTRGSPWDHLCLPSHLLWIACWCWSGVSFCHDGRHAPTSQQSVPHCSGLTSNPAHGPRLCSGMDPLVEVALSCNPPWCLDIPPPWAHASMFLHT